MDKLDKYSILIIVILIASLVIVGLEYQGEADSNLKSRIAKNGNVSGASEIPPEKLDMIKVLIASNNMKKAEAVVVEMLQKYPYEGGPYMLNGDIMMRKQGPVSAIYSFRTAVELEPDYVDKKTPLFQGRKIKVAVDEAKKIIDKALAKDPGNGDMKKARKTMYYLLRSLAGSCG